MEQGSPESRGESAREGHTEGTAGGEPGSQVTRTQGFSRKERSVCKEADRRKSGGQMHSTPPSPTVCALSCREPVMRHLVLFPPGPCLLPWGTDAGWRPSAVIPAHCVSQAGGRICDHCISRTCTCMCMCVHVYVYEHVHVLRQRRSPHPSDDDDLCDLHFHVPQFPGLEGGNGVHFQATGNRERWPVEHTV